MNLVRLKTSADTHFGKNESIQDMYAKRQRINYCNRNSILQFHRAVIGVYATQLPFLEQITVAFHKKELRAKARNMLHAKAALRFTISTIVSTGNSSSESLHPTALLILKLIPKKALFSRTKVVNQVT